MIENNLNLARKWRSKSFDQIVGQDLAVKILRNSLYLNHFFPVYLFSGQRGCGKTSAARIFACALNCKNLDLFQKDPKIKLPCLECDSCLAMAQSRHPDFIEMDAASHTGVDNIRQIIDSSTFLPVLGKKKIYLIDEAHMLSKSAFNAFLKLLEEPPAFVTFILATTDPEKIIETVKSRCFQVLFNFINQDSLVEHLKNICESENIKYDISGLEVIFKQSQGSARDAINLLEQVRFSSSIVDKKSVQRVLGHPSQDALLELMRLLNGASNYQELHEFLGKLNFDAISYDYVYYALMELAKNIVYIKNGVDLKDSIVKESGILQEISLGWVLVFLDLLVNNELIFQKSSNKKLVLELLFIKILALDGTVAQPSPVSIPALIKSSNTEIEKKNFKKVETDDSWSSFLTKVSEFDDPVLTSIFKQAQFDQLDNTNMRVRVFIDKKFSFLQHLLEESKPNWLKILKEVFGDRADLDYILKEGIVSEQKGFAKVEAGSATSTTEVKSVANSYNSSGHSNQAQPKKDFVIKKQSNATVSSVDISDKQTWKLSNSLVDIFPGKIIEINENSKE